MLSDPYPRKNAGFDSLEELHMVRGVTEDFWSTFVEPNPDDPHSRPVTVWGQGATNVNTANAQAILAIVCANALNAPMCTDMQQAMQFLSTVNLVRTFTQGAPVFNSAQDFIAAMKGQGPVGEILAAIGVQPVTFLSDSDAMKTIATQSKVFSIVATGYVKGPHRETKVKIHAVVDFRGAPAPNAALTALAAATGAGGAANQLAAAAAAGGASSGNANLSPEEAAQQAITGALKADPAGKVIYFRIN
jgi:general secretion pathway protein K